MNFYHIPTFVDPLCGSIFVYFGQSNTAGQIIIFLLLLFSLLAWTVMVGKYMDLKRFRELNTAFEKQLGTSGLLRGLEFGAGRSVQGPHALLTRAALEALQRGEQAGGSEALRIALVENALQRAVARTTVVYESKMVVLGSIVTGAPFMGLLGTVWGVMDAFGAIAGGSAGGTIQSLAPGVSGALLTTVAGLLVAIPSVFGYNYLLTETKILTTELENFASDLADRLEIELRE